jgi:hypothetical protein
MGSNPEFFGTGGAACSKKMRLQTLGMHQYVAREKALCYAIFRWATIDFSENKGYGPA